MKIRLLAILGGSWHDFPAFATWLDEHADALGTTSQVSFVPSTLTSLCERRHDVVLLYNCYDEQSRETYTSEQIQALHEWVRAGGRLLALHSATVAARGSPELRRLLGGAFLGHPPACSIEIRSAGNPRVLTPRLDTFVVRDELYHHELERDICVHLIAKDEQGDHPVVWTRKEGNGRVAYVGLGHDIDVWQQKAFLQVLKQALEWLTWQHG